jgi:hypothetical protein
VPYIALIAPDQDTSGPYGGLSFVVFPADESGPPLICMGVGTQSIAPDDRALGRPGHARQCRAITRWLASLPDGGFAWAKREPVNTDEKVASCRQRASAAVGQLAGKVWPGAIRLPCPGGLRHTRRPPSDGAGGDGLR